MAPLNQALKFGFITGLALIAYSVTLYVANVNLFGTVFSIVNGLITFGVMIFMTVFAINKTRDLMLSGKITFLQSFLVGAVTLLIMSYVNSIFNFVLNYYIDPAYMTAQLDNFIADMEGKVPEATLETIIESMEANLDPMKNLIKGLWITPLFAIGVSAIISLFIKKDITAQA
jgi:hypothetical protein